MVLKLVDDKITVVADLGVLVVGEFPACGTRAKTPVVFIRLNLKRVCIDVPQGSG